MCVWVSVCLCVCERERESVRALTRLGVYQSVHIYQNRSPRSLRTDMLDCDYEFQLRYYVHFWTNTIGKRMISLITQLCYGLNSTITVPLKGWYSIKKTTKLDLPLYKKIKLNQTSVSIYLSIKRRQGNTKYTTPCQNQNLSTSVNDRYVTR